MPCRSCPDEYSSIKTEYVDNPKLVKRLDEVTALLCDTLNEIKVRTPKTYQKLLDRNSDLNKWWIAHQLADEKRTGKKFNRIKKF
jgi:hypothetical protein